MNTQEQLAAVLALTTKGIGPRPDYAEIDVHPGAFIRADSPDVVRVSAEDGQPWADFYGEFRGNYPWINPVLVEWAAANCFFWEWEDPGSIALYTC